ncbi:MAG: Ni/Fe-hydrogenase cytochrome b subunit [Desulfobacteraceae bacterium]|nr:Ni/Fe-hydrogenase cytochrome b subunit [Desulfobacteraceae bacterium]
MKERTMMESHRPLGGKIVTKPFIVLTLLALTGVVFMIQRYRYGLGAVTHLSDGYPWGIWITYDVLVGTALGCGGYATAILVYIFNRWEYHPLIRSAVLTSAFGYTLAAAAIFLDIGRYWNAYHLFFPWYVNFNSVLVEVALCIAAYVVVLWLEVAPAVMEGHPSSNSAQSVKRRVERWLPMIVAFGILLPTMHQSSLGAMMIIAGYKVSPLWQSGLLPLFFLLSAIAMGYAVTLFESLLSSLFFGRPFETHLIKKMGGVMAWVIGVYLILRFADLAARGQLNLIAKGDLNSAMFILENFCYLAAFLLLASKAWRENPRTLFIAAALMLLAGALYRFDTYLVGFNPGPGWHYFPALPEILITVGIVAIELMAYLYFVKRYPVLPAVGQAKHA